MKIYTKTGDKGETSLFDGRRVPKDDLYIEACGTVDELNTVLGIIRSAPVSEPADAILGTIQNHLFIIGSDLATPPGRNTRHPVPRITADMVGILEKAIDDTEERLPVLKNFILPCGTPSAARFHFARAVCRRAERCVVRLSRQTEINPHTIVYLNRLSDLFFVFARLSNVVDGISDIPWNST